MSAAMDERLDEIEGCQRAGVFANEDGRWLLEQLRILVAKSADDSLIFATAKASWDRGERDYWDSERDMRAFDPSVSELDGDDCDRGKEWLEIVTEVINDFREALGERVDGA